MKRTRVISFIVMVHLLFGVFVTAEDKGAGPSDIRLQKAYHAMLMADQSREQGDVAAAIKSYSDALEIYNDLAANYPKEQKETVKFRTMYCNNQLDKMLKESDRIKILKKKEIDQKPDAKAGDEKVDKLIASALGYIKNGDTEKARTILMGGLSVDPDSSELRLLMGIAQCQAGKYKDALYILDFLVEEEPENAYALTALASAHLGMNDSAAALRKMELALAAAPENPEINFNMAQLLLAVDPPSPEEAMKYYKKAMRLGAEPDEALERELKKF